MGSKYLKLDWWKEWLGQVFPESFPEVVPSWGFRLPVSFSTTYWYKVRNFVLGFQYKDELHRPHYTIRALGRDDPLIDKDFDMEDPNFDLMLIAGLADPRKLVACMRDRLSMGTSVAGAFLVVTFLPVMEQFFEGATPEIIAPNRMPAPARKRLRKLVY